ncbi:MAG: rhomboid family intramembrane serine protease [Solirubrobacterales bacterium]
MPIPLKDNIPTLRFPIVTVLLIAVNIGFFLWQLTAPTDGYSSGALRALGLNERDERSVQYGAIPYRLLHPGSECAAGVTEGPSGLRSQIVCEGTPAYDRAGASGEPFEPVKEAPWLITAFTSMFMHGGFLHIFFNMLFLWIFGNNIEDAMGRVRFVLFYLAAGLVAVYSQAALAPDSTVPTIGASGAVAGVLGAYLVLLPKARVLTLIFLIFFVTLVEIPAYVLLGIWFVLQFIPAVGQVAVPDIGGGGVAYFAHVGGFLFGMAVVRLLARRRPEVGGGPPQPVPAGPG